MADSSYKGYPNPGRLLHYQREYGAYHASNPKRLSGKFPPEQIEKIKECVQRLEHYHATATNEDRYGSLSDIKLLDYGSGKGYQYLSKRVHEDWGGYLPICYDPGVIQLSARPDYKFDGVICCDVLEHIEKQDLRDLLWDIFNYVHKDRPSFIYLHTCCRPAHKHFPDGRNLHRTIQPPEWWEALIQPYTKGFRQLDLQTTYENPQEDDPPFEDVGPVFDVEEGK